MASTVSLCVTAVAGLFILIGLLGGLKRGLIRSVFHLVCMAVSLALTLLFNQPLVHVLYGKFGTPLQELIRESMGDTSLLDSLKASSATLSQLIDQLPEVIISLVTFGIFFLLCYWILLIPTSIILHVTLNEPKNKVVNSLTGMAVGAVAGFVMFAVLLTPVTGLAQTASDAVATLSQTDAFDADTLEQFSTLQNEYLAPLNNNWAVAAAKTSGTTVLFEQMTTVTLNNNSFSLNQEAKALINVVGVVQAKEGETSDEQLQRLAKALPEIMESSDLTTQILAESLPVVAKEALETGKLLGEDMTTGNEELDQLFSEALKLYAEQEVTAETVTDDVALISQLYAILASYDFEGEDAMRTVLESDMIPKILDLFASNPRYNDFVDACVQTALGSLDLDSDPDLAEGIDELAEMFASMKSADELADKLVSMVGTGPNGEHLERSVALSISRYLMDRYAGVIKNGDDLRAYLKGDLKAN